MVGRSLALSRFPQPYTYDTRSRIQQSLCFHAAEKFKSTSPLLICFTPPLLGRARCFAFCSNRKFWTAHSEVRFDHHCSGIDRYVLHELAKKVKI
jgi:hypothetical protein